MVQVQQIQQQVQQVQQSEGEEATEQHPSTMETVEPPPGVPLQAPTITMERPQQPLMSPRDAFIVTMFDMFFTRGDAYDSVNITTFKLRFLAPFLVKTTRHVDPSAMTSQKRPRSESIIDAFTRLYNQGWVLPGATVFVKTKFGDRQGQCVATGIKLKVEAVPTAASILNLKLAGPIDGYPGGKRIRDFLGSLLIPTFADLYKLTHAGNKKSLSAGPKDPAMEHHIHRRRRRVIRGGSQGGLAGTSVAKQIVQRGPSVPRAAPKSRVPKVSETVQLAMRVELLHAKVDKLMEALLSKEVLSEFHTRHNIHESIIPSIASVASVVAPPPPPQTSESVDHSEAH